MFLSPELENEIAVAGEVSFDIGTAITLATAAAGGAEKIFGGEEGKTKTPVFRERNPVQFTGPEGFLNTQFNPFIDAVRTQLGSVFPQRAGQDGRFQFQFNRPDQQILGRRSQAQGLANQAFNIGNLRPPQAQEQAPPSGPPEFSVEAAIAQAFPGLTPEGVGAIQDFIEEFGPLDRDTGYGAGTAASMAIFGPQGSNFRSRESARERGFLRQPTPEEERVRQLYLGLGLDDPFAVPVRPQLDPSGASGEEDS